MCDGQDLPIMLLLTESQMSGHNGASLQLDALPKAKDLPGDKGYNSDWFRDALTERGINPLHSATIKL